MRNITCDNIPLIPSEVTPWLTAFKAYSMSQSDTQLSQLSVGAYLFEPAFHYFHVSKHVYIAVAMRASYLGENVVSENEYRSAMAKDGQLSGRVGRAGERIAAGWWSVSKLPQAAAPRQRWTRRLLRSDQVGVWPSSSGASNSDSDIWTEPNRR